MFGSSVRTNILRKNKLFFLAVLSLTVFLIGPASQVQAQAGSEVNAIICGSGAGLDITGPPSDSVITESTVVVKGTVFQTSQIEIRIDGGYNGSVPIDTAQQEFEAPVELTAGTHTITLKAIDTCGLADSEKSVVITYAAAPSLPSNGDQTPTAAGGVTISNAGTTTVSQSTQSLLPSPVTETWDTILRWLNITGADASNGTGPHLSFIRALTIAIGTYLATIGLAVTVVNFVASLLPLGNISASKRYQLTSRGIRVVGVALLLVGLFL